MCIVGDHTDRKRVPWARFEYVYFENEDTTAAMHWSNEGLNGNQRWNKRNKCEIWLKQLTILSKIKELKNFIILFHFDLRNIKIKIKNIIKIARDVQHSSKLFILVH